MTANERIELLLREARETLADIPPVRDIPEENVKAAVAGEFGAYSEENALRYIVFLAEILDRLERGVDNILHSGVVSRDGDED